MLFINCALDKSIVVKYKLIMLIRLISTIKISSILIFLFFIFGPSQSWAFSVGETPCLTCHMELSKPAKSVHAVMASGCYICHRLVEGKNHPEQKDSIKLTQNVPGLCYSCHDETGFKGKSLHPPVVIDTCTVCHNPHQSNFGKLLTQDIPELCYNCHSESKFRGKVVHTPVGKGLCLSCHNAHASNFTNILTEAVPEICYTCHKKEQFTRKYVHPVAVIPNGCILCHSPHANDYPHLLPNSINEVCISCHEGKETGRHVVSSLPGGIVHPVKGVQDPSDPRREISCISCHNPHSSNFAKLYQSARICHRCHPSY
jgi:predicted CXXCH cytochrome family protein